MTATKNCNHQSPQTQFPQNNWIDFATTVRETCHRSYMLSRSEPQLYRTQLFVQIHGLLLIYPRCVSHDSRFKQRTRYNHRLWSNVVALVYKGYTSLICYSGYGYTPSSLSTTALDQQNRLLCQTLFGACVLDEGQLKAHQVVVCKGNLDRIGFSANELWINDPRVSVFSVEQGVFSLLSHFPYELLGG